MPKIRLCLISDEGYVRTTSVAVRSILENIASARFVELHIIAANLSVASKSLLASLEGHSSKIIIHEEDPARLEGLHHFDEKAICVATKAALFKFLLPEILPELDKVLYLDGDVIVRGDLGELHDIELTQDEYVAAVPDSGQIYYRHEFVKKVTKYFNSGVMLLNLKAMRENSLGKKLIETKAAIKDANLMDQNVFNLVFDKHVKYLPIKWNFLPVSLERARGKWRLSDINRLFECDYASVRDLFADAKIIHYSSKDKPWNSDGGALAYEWWINAEKHSKPLVSVVIPAYNVEKYVSAALDKLLAQTYENWEAIVLDDGSSDNTAAILKAYAAKCPKITVIENTNHRQGYERNRGLELAKGKYVYFLDADDELEEGALKRLVEVAEAEKLDLVYFEGESFYENRELEKAYPRFKTVYRRKEAYPRIYTGEDLYGKLREKGELIISPCLQFLSREMLERASVGFPETMSMMEDNIFTVKAILAAKRARVLPDRLFRRRVRSSSTMTEEKRGEKEVKAIHQIVSCLAELEKFYRGETAHWLRHHMRAFLRTAVILEQGEEKARDEALLRRLDKELEVFSSRHKRSVSEWLEALAKCYLDNGLIYTFKNLLGKMMRR